MRIFTSQFKKCYHLNRNNFLVKLMFRKLSNISSFNIKQNLEKSGIDLSKSKFSDESWHTSSPNYEAIREELLALDEYNKNSWEKFFIKAEIVSLADFAHEEAYQVVLDSAIEHLELMTPGATQFNNDLHADNTDLTGETGEMH